LVISIPARALPATVVLNTPLRVFLLMISVIEALLVVAHIFFAIGSFG
jgi:hypothetical protein